MSKKKEEKLLTVDDVRVLREEIALMHGALVKDVLEHVPLIKKVVERFVEKGLESVWVEKLLAGLAGSPLEEDEEILVAYVLEELDALISVISEDANLTKTIRIVVGATGIGKTSLVGKLAARYKYFLKKSHSVALVNFDQHKVGAEEQLANYSEAMQIPLLAILELLEDEYDVIFVDTAGSAGYALDELEKFMGFIGNYTDYKIEILLALSATSKMRDLEKIYEAFNGLKIKNFILTKLDETTDLSDIINFLIKVKKPVSYISTGQKIPEDLEVASKEYILNRFMQD